MNAQPPRPSQSARRRGVVECLHSWGDRPGHTWLQIRTACPNSEAVGSSLQMVQQESADRVVSVANRVQIALVEPGRRGLAHDRRGNDTDAQAGHRVIYSVESASLRTEQKGARRRPSPIYFLLGFSKASAAKMPRGFRPLTARRHTFSGAHQLGCVFQMAFS